MNAVEQIMAAAAEAKVTAGLYWHAYNHTPERQPEVRLKINHATWSVFFDQGKRGPRFSTAATSNRRISTLTAVLQLIRTEGQRRDAEDAERRAR